MSGRMSGVQKFVADKYPTAIYVHCASHSLNLAIGNAVDIPEIRNCFGTVEKVCTFFSYPKRSAVLKEMIESSSKKTKLKHFSPTRWIERHDSILVMAELFDFIIMSLDKISTWRDRDTSSFSSILERAMTAPNFIVALYSIEKLFSYTLPLSRLLQTVNCDLAKALQHVTVTTNAIKEIRANVEAAFSEIYEKARRKFSELGVTESMPRRMPVEQENPEMFYRRTLFVPFCDHIITQLESRFEKHSAIVSSFLALLPSGSDVKESNLKELISLAEFYRSDMRYINEEEFLTECRLWYAQFKNAGNDIPSDAINAFLLADASIYPNVHTLLKIFCTLPVTTCTGERSFSTLRRIKSYLRSTMGNERLSALALLNIHREIDISTKEVLCELSKVKRRLEISL